MASALLTRRSAEQHLSVLIDQRGHQLVGRLEVLQTAAVATTARPA